jgi:hypothetical protein
MSKIFKRQSIERQRYYTGREKMGVNGLFG